MTVPTDAVNRRSPRLSRELVLQAALQIIDEDGVDGLSVRRLARALDRDPMSLYRYASTRAELLDEVAEAVLAPLTVDTTDEDWAAQLRSVARRFRGIARAHPHAVPLFVTRTPGHPRSHCGR